MLSKIKNVKGFTLIELMVVVAIIGIILAIAVPYYMAYKRSACDTTAAGDVSKLGASIERLGDELVHMNCMSALSNLTWNQTTIQSLVGPYYGWGGTSAKCDVRIAILNCVGGGVINGTRCFVGCALNGSSPIEGQRYLFQVPVEGGADLPAVRGVCNGNQYVTSNTTPPLNVSMINQDATTGACSGDIFGGGS